MVQNSKEESVHFDAAIRQSSVYGLLRAPKEILAEILLHICMQE